MREEIRSVALQAQSRVWVGGCATGGGGELASEVGRGLGCGVWGHRLRFLHRWMTCSRARMHDTLVC